MLIEFNLANRPKLDEIERLAKEQIPDLVSESDGFESMCGDSVCDSFHSSDEDSDEEKKQDLGNDPDEFETVVKKRR
jgi:hypothetical protein